MKIFKISLILVLFDLSFQNSMFQDESLFQRFTNSDPSKANELKEFYRKGSQKFRKLANRVLRKVPRKERRKLFNGENWGQAATGTGLYYWMKDRDKYEEEISKLEGEEFKQNLEFNVKKREIESLFQDFNAVLNSVADKLKSFEDKSSKNGERILKESHNKVKKWESMGVDMSDLHKEKDFIYLKQ